MKLTHLVATLCIVALALAHAHGQGGVSSTSFGIAKSGARHDGAFGGHVMPSPDFFRVEEFINYHRHQLPLPENNQRVRLDVQTMELEAGKHVVQFGITTPRALDSEKIPPLNLVLVIDESGSMGGEKIQRLKESLRVLVERFRKQDRITIVGFENEARMILPATHKTKQKKILAAIDDIHAGGGTNLHAGLMMGYRLAMENFDAERTNRLIFLTDGNANVGETHAAEIAVESQKCIEKGISLVTIGLGVDFNQGLLREIADSGRGVMHFIGDAKDIRKTFTKEVDSLLAPAASNVRLDVDFEDAAKVKVIGYEERLKTKGDRLSVKLDDLNHGATQVVLVRIKTDSIGGRVKLKYVDAITNKKVTLSLNFAKIESGDSESVRRNFAIAKIANGIKAAARFCHNSDCSRAAEKIRTSLKKADKLYHREDDKHVRRVAKIAESYLCQLRPAQVSTNLED